MNLSAALVILSAVASASFVPARLATSALARTKFNAPDPGGFVTRLLAVPLDYGEGQDKDDNTFQIRYHVDDGNFDGTGEAPIMISMGQEGTMDSVRCGPDMVSNNAVCVQIEHRFYGESVPDLSIGGGSNENFAKGLTVEANLKDTAAVVDAVQALYPVLDAAGEPTGRLRPVVIFGGSYSGATATWFRMAYPDKCAGAVSSSGVINAVYDFVEFDETVAAAISEPDEECAETLRGIQEEIDAGFRSGEGADMKRRFNATNLVGSKMGDADFMYMLADGYSMIDQYGGKAELCDGLRADPTIEGLAGVLTGHFGADFGNDCYYDSDCLSVENNEEQVGGLMGSQNSRSWRWQKCSQVAYLQARPQGASALRSPLLTLEALEDQCQYVFGSVPARDGGNAALNAKFGADSPQNAPDYDASNVFSISYKDDPWKAASATRDNGESLPYCYADCDGCGHCGAGVSEEDAKICGEPQAVFVDQVLAQARFQGHFSDPNHVGDDREVVVKVDGKAMHVEVSGADAGNAWGPLPAKVDGVKIVVDFSSKGGPSDLTGSWDAVADAIVWADGNAWTKL